MKRIQTPAITLAIILSTSLFSSPVLADDLPNPPTYFSIYRVNVGVAHAVARRCETLEINAETYRELAETQFQRLEQDGFSRTNWRKEMKDVPQGLKDRPKVEFYLKWGVNLADLESYCRAGRMEMKNGSMIGLLLKEVQ